MKLTAVLKARSGVIGVALAGACAVPKPCGFSGSTALQPLDRVGEDELRDAEREQRAGVRGPALLDVLADAAEP